MLRSVSGLSSAQAEISLVLSPAGSLLPVLPHTERLQLLIEMSLAHGLLDFCSMQALRDRFSSIGQCQGQLGCFCHMFLQLGYIDLVESIGARVIVDEVIRLFLIGNKCRHTFQHEIEIVGPPRRVSCKGARVELLQGCNQRGCSIERVFASPQGEASHTSNAGIEYHLAYNPVQL